MLEFAENIKSLDYYSKVIDKSGEAGNNVMKKLRFSGKQIGINVCLIQRNKRLVKTVANDLSSLGILLRSVHTTPFQPFSMFDEDGSFFVLIYLLNSIYAKGCNSSRNA